MTPQASQTQNGSNMHQEDSVGSAPNDRPCRAKSEKLHSLFWVGLILTFLGGQILMLSGMVYIATSDPSFAVEPDYYQKGLNWDATANQVSRNRQLGWAVKITVARDSTLVGDRALTCSLTDPQGQPIEGAVVDLVAFPHSRGSQRISTSLQELEQGEYAGTVRFQRSGLWEFRLAIQRGADTFTHVVKRNVFPAGRE